MMFALLAFQSALACGPYGGFAMSDNGAWAYENDDAISVYTADGQYFELPIYGEVVDLDFVGDELVVGYAYKADSFAILFDEEGVEVAEWSPTDRGELIRNIMVLPEGLMVMTELDGYRTRVRLTDDLRPERRIRGVGVQRP